MKKYWNHDDRILVQKITVEYGQPGDCEDEDDSWQTLVLTTESNGVAPFIRMSLKDCDHFSLEGIEELQEIFEDFKEKVNYEEKDSCDQ